MRIVLYFPRRLIASVVISFFFSVPLLALGPAFIRGGDRVKIVFFESVEAPDTSSANPGNQSFRLLRTQYQRVDLSGEFVVDGGGMISVPMLGAVRFSGITPAAAADQLQRLLKEATGRAAIVSVAIVQRSPIYITGDVRSPGMFAFTPNMIAIQGVALAGGFENGQLQPSLLVEMLRLSREQTNARDRMKRLLARKAVLEKYRNDTAEVDIPAQLVQLSGQDGARSLIESARKVIQAREEAYSMEFATRAEAVGGIRQELELLKARISEFEAKIKLLAERARKMESLFARQVVEEQRVSTVLRDQVDMEGHRNELKVVIVQTSNRLSQAEGDLQQLKIKRRLEKDAEIQDIDAEIAQLGDTLAMTEATDSLTLDQSCCVANAMRLEIIRTNLGVFELLDAMDTTSLEPGDVLRVTRTRTNRPGRVSR